MWSVALLSGSDCVSKTKLELMEGVERCCWAYLVKAVLVGIRQQTVPQVVFANALMTATSGQPFDSDMLETTRLAVMKVHMWSETPSVVASDMEYVAHTANVLKAMSIRKDLAALAVGHKYALKWPFNTATVHRSLAVLNTSPIELESFLCRYAPDEVVSTKSLFSSFMQLLESKVVEFRSEAMCMLKDHVAVLTKHTGEFNRDVTRAFIDGMKADDGQAKVVIADFETSCVAMGTDPKDSDEYNQLKVLRTSIKDMTIAWGVLELLQRPLAKDPARGKSVREAMKVLHTNFLSDKDKRPAHLTAEDMTLVDELLAIKNVEEASASASTAKKRKGASASSGTAKKAR